MDVDTYMRLLEQQARELADRDGDVFLPNFRPKGPADYVLICMEPSRGQWAKTPEAARKRIAEGFRNFSYSLEDFILHAAARRHPCGPGQTYHLTDVSKGAMTVELANVDRPARYARWYTLLKQEIEVVAKPGAKFFTVGQAVRKELKRLGFAQPLTMVMHYSRQAGRARKAAIAGRESEFGNFAETVSLKDILETAEEVFRENDSPTPLAQEAIKRLERTEFTESRKMLLFIYRNAFLEAKKRSAPG